VTSLARCSAACAALLLAAAAPRAAEDGAAAEDRDARARAWFTDTRVVAQDGRELRFYTDLLAGRVVAISFFHTSCKDVCPAVVQSLNTVRHQLGPLFGKRVTFVSISVDPENDTPERVAQFAKRQRADHPGWTFVTGRPDDLRAVHARLGRNAAEGPEDHAVLFFAGNVRTQHWVKLRRDLPPAEIAERLRLLAAEDEARPPAGAAATLP
jgi:protein SCO1/2